MLLKPHNLEKHHLIPNNQGGNNSDDNLVLLHLYCHDKVHRNHSKKVILPRYDAKFIEDREDWQSIAWNFQTQIPILEEPDFVSHWEYLFERSLGCVGILKNWTRNAFADAMEDEAKTITLKHLERRALSVGQCRNILKKIKEGESNYAAIEGEVEKYNITSLNQERNAEFNWYLWVTRNLGELMAKSSSCEISLDKEIVSKTLLEYARQHTNGNIAALARQLKMPKNTVWLWCKRKNQPSLEMLLRICYGLKVSVIIKPQFYCLVALMYSFFRFVYDYQIIGISD